MTSNLMFMIMGFLLALLLALLVMPLVWRSAVRVTTKRVKEEPWLKKLEERAADLESGDLIAEHSRNTLQLEKRLQGLKERLTTQAVETAWRNTEIDELHNTVTEMERSLGERDAEVERCRKVILSLETEASLHAETVEQLHGELTESANARATLERRLEEIEAAQSERQAAVSRLEVSIEESSKTLSGKDAEIATLQEGIDNQRDRIGELEAELAARREEIEKRNADVARVKAERDRRQQEAAALGKRLEALQSERGVLMADLDLAGRETTRLLDEFDQLDQLWQTKFQGDVPETRRSQKPGETADAAAARGDAKSTGRTLPAQDSLAERFRALQERIG